jgi:Tfp pilus assembly protein PilO
VKKQIPLTPVLAAGLLIVVLVGWFALVGPKRAQSAALDEQIADYETKIMLAAQEQSPDEPPAVEIRVADLFRLAKAMPDREDMPGVILELNSVALSTGIAFVSIAPGTAVTRTGHYSVPITLTFEGNYYDLTDFLFRLRNLVSVHDGVLDATGRLYTLDSLEFNESEAGFPEIQATLVLSAYAFGVPVVPGVTPAPPATTTGATTTGATTGETTTGETTTTGGTEGPPADPTGDGNPEAAGGTP